MYCGVCITFVSIFSFLHTLQLCSSEVLEAILDPNGLEFLKGLVVSGAEVNLPLQV